MELFPEVELEIRSSKNSRELAEQLQRNEIDLSQPSQNEGSGRRVIVASHGFAVKLALAGAGSLISPDSLVEEYTKTGELIPLEEEVLEMNLWYQMIYHKNKWMTGVMQVWSNLQGEKHDPCIVDRHIE